MSFFSNGFAVLANSRRLKAAKKAGKNGADKSAKSSTDKKEKKDEGRWDMLTDAYGRTYWQHNITGEWTYGYGAGLVSPVGTVNPSPMGYPGGPIFTPSPVPGGALYPFAVAPPAKKEKKDDDEKDEKKEKGKGWWETKYDEDGDRYWEHTVTKKTTYKDPYY
ncbi:unnamed protein product [Ectocarpus fasciculatus]